MIVSGQGVVLEFGKHNPGCQYAMAPNYIWSDSDKSELDSSKRPPRSVWHFHPDTVVVPISFLRLEWSRNNAPGYRYQTLVVKGPFITFNMWP